MITTTLREQQCPDCGHARPIGLDGVIEAHTALRVDYEAEGQPVRREWCQDAFSRAVREVLAASVVGRLDEVVRERWQWAPELEAVAWLRRMQLGWSPLSREEIALDHARWLLGPFELLGIARGDRAAVKSTISSRSGARSGGPSAAARGYRSHVEGAKVHYHYDPEPEGTLRVVELLELAAAHETPEKLATLTVAVTHRSDVVAEEDELFGPFYSRGRDLYRSPEWETYQARRSDAERAMLAASDAWWSS